VIASHNQQLQNIMKTVTKFALATFAASIVGAGAAMADSAVTRENHPNQQTRFVYGPQSNGPLATTVGVYENGRSFGSGASSNSGATRANHANGTPTFIFSPQLNGPVGVR
jgi:hypothetical protein